MLRMSYLVCVVHCGEILDGNGARIDYFDDVCADTYYSGYPRTVDVCYERPKPDAKRRLLEDPGPGTCVGEKLCEDHDYCVWYRQQ